MATKNDASTRFYSQKQEASVAKALGGTVNSNSGAGLYNKSDVIVKDASLSIECKKRLDAAKEVIVKKVTSEGESNLK